MTITDPTTIDIVATRPDADVVRLVITDHLDWTAELDHLAMLQEKVNTYLAFVETGELGRSHPEAAGRAVQIEIRFLHEPTEHARRHFLDRAEEVVGGAGMTLVWTVDDGGAA